MIWPGRTGVAAEHSPLAFEAGAFRRAAYVEPEPLIVPVAVANFDKNIARTRLAAVVHEPFKLSDFVPRPVAQQALFDCVDGYRERFAGFVREAAALANAPRDG